MARNFYYGKDSRIVAGSAHFAALINQDPSAYNILPQRAAEYAALDATLQSAYHAASTPQTRTPVAVREKDDALRIVRRAASALAGVVYASANVDNAQLISLGLGPRPKRAAERAVPAEPPIVQVAMVVGRLVTVRIAARGSSETRKPLGCLGAQLYVFCGDAPPSDPQQYRFEGIATRKTATIRFPDHVASGSTAWVSAAWISRRGKAGAACEPVQVTIQGGPVLSA